MKILALDSSTEACSVAICNDGECMELYDEIGRGHAEHLLPMIQTLLLECDTSLAAIDLFAFGAGPGSFTGLRIGAAMTQGLALASDRQVVAVSSLQALAARQQGTVLAMIDARMEQVYHALYRHDEEMVPVALGNEAVASPSALQLPRGEDIIVVGSGWDRYQQEIQDNMPVDTQLLGHKGEYPHARDIALLAMKTWQSGGYLDVAAALPHYVRNDVAKKMSGKKT